jgi:hypothetical protein
VIIRPGSSAPASGDAKSKPAAGYAIRFLLRL